MHGRQIRCFLLLLAIPSITVAQELKATKTIEVGTFPKNLREHWLERQESWPKYIKRYEDGVNEAQSEYALAQRGTINPRLRGDDYSKVKSGKVERYVFKNRAVKDRKLQQLREAIPRVEKSLEVVKAMEWDLPELDSFYLPEVGDVGRVNWARILNVADKNNVLVLLGPKGDGPFWISGVDVSAVADGRVVSISAPLLATGTTTYETAIGGRRTVVVLQPISDKEIDKWKNEFKP